MTELDMTQPFPPIFQAYIERVRNAGEPMDIGDVLSAVSTLPVETQAAVVAKLLEALTLESRTKLAPVVIKGMGVGCSGTHAEVRAVAETLALGFLGRYVERASQAESALSTATARIAELEREVERLRQAAINGWESARLLAICPPTFGAPATEKAADEALAKLQKPPEE